MASRLGPNLRADGFPEFSEYVDKARSLEASDPANSQRLLDKAQEMLPQLEQSVENILSVRDQIRAKMLKVANEVMDEYDEALRELAK